MPASSSSGPSGSKTILIVEDHALNLKLFDDLLTHNGYTTIVTSLGEAAVELARQNRPDLIVLDIQLPDISGMDAAHRLKADEETRAIPVLAVTAFAMSGDREKILASGCDDYLPKPFKVEDLLRIVAHHTSNGDKSGPS
jgi:two-component system, cell cycle response regulator DivK